MPPLDGIAGVSVVDEGERQLDAVYWDSDGLALAHAGVGLRRRNGTWTYKGTSHRDGDAVVREELEVDGGADAIPASIRDRVGRVADPASLHPVARLRTMRRTWRVTRGGESAELVHDRVTVLDPEGRDVASFAEVEVESHRAGDRLADLVAAALAGHGAVVDPTAKYVRALRALGHDPPEVSGSTGR